MKFTRVYQRLSYHVYTERSSRHTATRLSRARTRKKRTAIVSHSSHALERERNTFGGASSADKSWGTYFRFTTNASALVNVIIRLIAGSRARRAECGER